MLPFWSCVINEISFFFFLFSSAVRFGRVPKREKAKILAAMQKVNASSQEKALCAELEDELRLLTTIVRAHEETCDYTRDKVAGLVEKARSQSGYSPCPPQLVSTCWKSINL